MNLIKLVVVGDGAVGKTCLLATYTTNKFPEEYVPTVYDNYAGLINYQNETYRLELWDTAGQEEYENLRPVSYPNTDAFLVCFSLISPNSLENVQRKWIPELKNYCPGIPYILIGLKSDLRDNFESHRNDIDDTDTAPIKTEDVEIIKNNIGAADYIECSSCLKHNVKEAFKLATKVAIEKKQAKTKKCQLI